MRIAEDVLNEKISQGFVSISEDATIFEAVQKMTEHKVGAIVVAGRDNEVIGIWTERDLLSDILIPDFDHKQSRVSDYMSSPLYSVPHDTSLEKIQDMFLGLFIRHILIKKNGAYIGLVSIGDVLRALLLEKDKEIKTLNKIASWEYYENWGWDKKYMKTRRKT